MKLYFRSNGNMRLIGNPETPEDVVNQIDDFVMAHNYKSYYTIMRLAAFDPNYIEFDVGSYTEFFELDTEGKYDWDSFSQEMRKYYDSL